MVRAGAIPALETCLPDLAPPTLRLRQQCPEGFGTSPAICQLQSISRDRPVPVCQLQSSSYVIPDMKDWSDQDLAVLGLLFSECWTKATGCEASTQRAHLKSSAMARILKVAWKQCGVKLHEGQYVQRKKGYVFDGNALLKVLTHSYIIQIHTDHKHARAHTPHHHHSHVHMCRL